MTTNEIRVDASAVDTIAAVSRSTSWRLVGEIPLQFDAFHPQGMARVGSTWWISTVDIATRRGLMLAVDETGRLIDQVQVGDDHRYHPGGIDFDGTAFWVSSAEYRPHSTTTVFRFEPGRIPTAMFEVDDHIGAITRCGPQGDLVGWSWGSRRFYRWTIDGQLQSARTNPAFFVDHQDCQWLDNGRILCGGVAQVAMASGPAWLGGLGLLNADDLVMEREAPVAIYSPVTARVATHNPLWCEVVGNDLVVHFLPDDGAGAIVSYSTPLIGRSG